MSIWDENVDGSTHTEIRWIIARPGREVLGLAFTYDEWLQRLWVAILHSPKGFAREGAIALTQRVRATGPRSYMECSIGPLTGPGGRARHHS